MGYLHLHQYRVGLLPKRFFTKFLGARFRKQYKWAQSDLRFCKNEESKRFKINEKGVNWIEIHGENLYKILKNV